MYVGARGCSLRRFPFHLPAQSSLDLGAILSVVDSSLASILLKILYKHARQLCSSGIVRILVLPGVLGVQNVRIYTRKLRRNVQTKGFLLDIIRIEGRSVEDGVDDAAGGLDGHALAGAVGSTGPASVDEPSLAAVAIELLLKKVCIPSGVEGEEGGAEAGGKIRSRLDNASLGSSYLGRVAADEVVHGLTRRQLGYGRQDTEGIAGEENDVIGMACHLRLVVSIDMEDRVGDASILGLGHIEIVRHELAILFD